MSSRGRLEDSRAFACLSAASISIHFFVSPLLKPGMGLKMRVGIPGGWRFSWHLERVNGARSGVGVAFTRDGTVVDVASRSRCVLFCKV